MRAIAKKDFTVRARNGMSEDGNYLRKDRQVNAGDKFEVVAFLIPNGLGQPGEKWVRVRGSSGITLDANVVMFEYEG